MKPQLLYMPTHNDGKGALTVAEYGNESILPFCPKRVFMIYNVPQNIVRGGHGHKECHQFLICVAGMVEVRTQEGEAFFLDSTQFGLYVPPGNITRQLFLTPNACLVVLASHSYDESDYIYPRNPDETSKVR